MGDVCVEGRWRTIPAVGAGWQMVGVSRQTLSAALMRLQARGLLRVGLRSIELAE